MTTDEALTVLGLSSSSTLDDIDTAYRKLIKSYHPDKNQNRPEWSHSMTLLLNEAYKVARSNVRITPEKTSKESASPYYQNTADSIHSAWKAILEGVYLYYTFGLENIHLRVNGTFHLKYILSKKQMKNGKSILEDLTSQNLSSRDRKVTILHLNFCLAFLENMQIEKKFIADGSIHHKAYKHYYHGSCLLDNYIKKVLFPEDFSRLFLPPKCISLCEQEFLTVLYHYQSSTWVPEATIKLMVLESFTKLINYRTGRETSARP